MTLIEPKGSKRDFEGGFFGISSTLIDAHTLPGQTEGLKVGCGGMGGWVGLRNGWMGGFRDGRRDGWMGGGIQMHLVLYHQQTTRKKGHHDSWHFLCASLTVYVSSLHL